MLGSTKGVDDGELWLTGVLRPTAVADGWDPWPTCLLLAMRAGALHRVHLARLSGFEFDFQKNVFKKID